MKKIKRYASTLFVFLLTFMLVSACKEERPNMNYFHKVDPIKNIVVTFEDGSKEFTTSQEKPYGNNIEVDFPYYYPENSDQEIDISKMSVEIEFHEEVEVLTEIPDIVDLRSPLVIQIVNADGENEDVVITSNVKKSDRAKILKFSLPQASVFGTIVESVGMIGIDRKGKDLSSQVPEIEISEGATIVPDPSQPQNFNDKIEYTVTAQDGTVKKYVIDDIASINKFEIHKGVNIASWLSTPKYDGPERAAFFTEADVQLLSNLGFDHIRLCIDEVELWNEAGGKIRPYGFDLLHKAIEWCSKYNMRVLVDLHITRNHRFTNPENTLFTDPAEPAKFVKLWEDLSDELSEYPNSLVAYELLNEPVTKDPENWNRVSAMAINAIRAKEADRTIVVGVATSNSAVRYDDLTLPSTHQILFTFHYYGPYLFTAYGLQSTTGGRQDIPIQYPGQLVPDEWIAELPENWQSTGQRYYDKSTLEESIMKGINTAKRLNVPVFVGEFGTMNTSPEPSRTNWYRDVIEILNENDVPYTSFDYKGAGYSIVGENREVIYPNLVNVLTGK